jgi:uncharacterized protein
MSLRHALAVAVGTIGAMAPVLSPTEAHARDPAQVRAAESTAPQNKQLIARAFERWAAGGTGFFEEVLAPDVVWTIEGSSPTAGVYRGRQDFMERAVKPFANRLAAPVRPSVKQLWAEGDHVIAHWAGAATARDGRPYRNSYVWIFRMRGGRAVEVTAFLDLAAYDDVMRRIPAKAGSD